MNNPDKFTNKVNDYVKFRPSYPKEFIDYLHITLGMSGESVVADVGAGTGILTKLISPISGTVFAVEPNKNMRTACIEYCEGLGNITCVDGSAENTKLKDNCLDFITVAQAFHWFDADKTKMEFKRILKPTGKVILVWNSRVPENEMHMENDEICRRLCPEFKGFSGSSKAEDERYISFFENSECERTIFKNDRVLTLDQFIGGSLSASYSPNVDDLQYDDFVGSLKNLFHKYSVNGKLLVPNNTRSYAGLI